MYEKTLVWGVWIWIVISFCPIPPLTIVASPTFSESWNNSKYNSSFVIPQKNKYVTWTQIIETWLMLGLPIQFCVGKCIVVWTSCGFALLKLPSSVPRKWSSMKFNTRNMTFYWILSIFSCIEAYRVYVDRIRKLLVVHSHIELHLQQQQKWGLKPKC